MKPYKMEPYKVDTIVEAWERWCRVTSWSILLKRFGELGGKVIWHCGYPRSKSAIPLCFSLYLHEEKLPCNSRLKDLREATKIAEREIAMYLDWTTLATINEFDEACCPNCGSWAAIEDLKTGADGNTTCLLCRY